MAGKKKILFIVEAMGGGVFTYIVDLANELVNKYDMYIAYAVRKQTPADFKEYFDKKIQLIQSEWEHQETLKLTRNATYVSNGININELQKMVDPLGETEAHPFTVFTLGSICYQKNPKLYFAVCSEIVADADFYGQAVAE
jgi:hypothetical protein